jgi:hypothetical protein
MVGSRSLQESKTLRELGKKHRGEGPGRTEGKAAMAGSTPMGAREQKQNNKNVCGNFDGHS